MSYQRVLFLGDSITEGLCVREAQNIYVNRLEKLLGAEKVMNHGIGGTTLARNTNDYRYRSFVVRSQELPDEAWHADLAFIFGGTNDFWIGNAPFGPENSSNPFEINGALNIIINTLKGMNPSMQIILVTPTPRREQDTPNQTTGSKLDGYVEVILAAAKRHHVPCCDLFRVKEFDPWSYDEYDDGLHPNDKGHERIANELYKFVCALNDAKDE